MKATDKTRFVHNLQCLVANDSETDEKCTEAAGMFTKRYLLSVHVHQHQHTFLLFLWSEVQRVHANGLACWSTPGHLLSSLTIN